MRAIIISLALLFTFSVAQADNALQIGTNKPLQEASEEQPTGGEQILDIEQQQQEEIESTIVKEQIDQMWDRANTAYVNGQFDNAIAIYDSLVAGGWRGAKLYYNLGNAYYKKQQIGNSILNYNRALMLDPSDSDVRHNLAIANNYVKDNIEKVPEFFLITWVKAWRSLMSSNAWAATSLVLLLITLGAVLVYLLSERMVLRKVGFYLAFVGLVLTVFAIIFATSEKREQLRSNDAIIMTSSTSVKSSPDTASKDIFILHEGTKVEIVSTLGSWCEIMIEDGNKGWRKVSAVEKIRAN